MIKRKLKKKVKFFLVLLLLLFLMIPVGMYISKSYSKKGVKESLKLPEQETTKNVEETKKIEEETL